MKDVSTGASALALAALLSSGAFGASRPASCTLVVKGKTYINGPCDFDADKDGSFRISGKDYFAYVNVTGKTAEASWNADPKSTHAQAPLGVLTRKGACWENADARICARDLPAAQRAAALAARPKGEYIYPEYPGASQSCIVVRGGKWVEGALLVLDTCPGDGSPNRFLRAGSEIRIDKTAGLCVGVAQGGAKTLVALQKCGDAGAQWSTTYKNFEAAALRSSDNACWTIPKLADEKAKFPFEIVVAPCDPKADRQLKFFFEKPS
ncbi:MAG: RICIN domain-containing protein [Rhodoblastus sp.]|nr:RICIN domain-containing protein [Rhodoblastus sp.]